MFDIITKQDYWSWLQQGFISTPTGSFYQAGGKMPAGFIHKLLARIQLIYAPPHPYELKDVQDAFILSRIQEADGKRILEVGGGNPRLLRQLSKNNDCWLIDKFKGAGGGPKQVPRSGNIRIVQGYMGEFLEQVPSGTFDYVFSVSVVEHVPLENLENFFVDCARVLKPLGRMLHAIDTYVFDPSRGDLMAPFRARIQAYHKYAHRPDLGIKLIQMPRVDENLSFSCSYATVPDNVLHQWYLNRKDDKRVYGQVVSIKSEWEKHE